MRGARWAVFLSGRGSNAEAMWELLPNLDVALCVSSRRKAYGVLRARRLGIETLILTSQSSWAELTRSLRQRGVTHVMLLGFMKILPVEFVEAWAGKMWNLHPSLLPEFPGLHAIEKSHEAGGRMGVTIHQVTEEMDAGPLALQACISENAKQLSLPEAQLKISQAEQRLVREWVLRKNRRVLKWN